MSDTELKSNFIPNVQANGAANIIGLSLDVVVAPPAEQQQKLSALGAAIQQHGTPTQKQQYALYEQKILGKQTAAPVKTIGTPTKMI